MMPGRGVAFKGVREVEAAKRSSRAVPLEFDLESGAVVTPSFPRIGSRCPVPIGHIRICRS